MSWFVFFFFALALVDLTLFRFYILSYFFESCLNFIVLVSFIFFFKIAYKMIIDFNSFLYIFCAFREFL